MGKGYCAEYEVGFTETCRSAYQKLQKRMDPRLYRKIEGVFDSLKTAPRLGHKLTGPLRGKSSAPVPEFDYRIIYEINDARCQVTIDAVGPHNTYKKLERYLRSRGRKRLGR